MTHIVPVAPKLLAPYGCAELLTLSTKAGDGKGLNTPVPSAGIDVLRLVAKVGNPIIPGGDGKGFGIRDTAFGLGVRVVRRRSAP